MIGDECSPGVRLRSGIGELGQSRPATIHQVRARSHVARPVFGLKLTAYSPAALGAVPADPETWAALRPVHLQNVGAPPEAPIPEFWQRIYQAAGLDPANAWTVESFVDRRKVRAYFNSGCMAFAPQRGILRAWRDVYEQLLGDPANHAFYTASEANAIFCHQAVLSAVVAAKAGRERVNLLPPSYGYPLPLQDQPGFTNRMTSLSDMVIVIGGTADNLRNIEITEPYKRWIEINVR